MVERFVEQSAAIQATTTDPHLKLSLSHDDRQKAVEFIRTMKPLYTSSLCVSADKSPTCSQIFPILKKLEAHFQTQDEDSELAATLKEKVWADLSTCYKVCSVFSTFLVQFFPGSILKRHSPAALLSLTLYIADNFRM